MKFPFELKIYLKIIQKNRYPPAARIFPLKQRDCKYLRHLAYTAEKITDNSYMFKPNRSQDRCASLGIIHGEKWFSARHDDERRREMYKRDFHRRMTK